MKEKFKRVVSIFLVVLMLLTSAPLEGFIGVDLLDAFSVEAEAITDKYYNVTFDFTIENPSEGGGHVMLWYYRISENGTVDTSSPCQFILIDSLSDSVYPDAGERITKVANVPGWPYRIEVALKNKIFCASEIRIHSFRIEGRKAFEGEYTMETTVFSSSTLTKTWEIDPVTGAMVGDFAGAYCDWPVPSIVSPKDIEITANKFGGGTVSRRIDINPRDQYDVAWTNATNGRCYISRNPSGTDTSGLSADNIYCDEMVYDGRFYTTIYVTPDVQLLNENSPLGRFYLICEFPDLRLSVPVVVKNPDYIDDGKVTGFCGDNLIWMLDPATGELVISGQGSMYDYAIPSGSSVPDHPWKNYSSVIKSVVVEEGVTSIGRYAFAYLYNLADVKIPSTVLSIGNYALSFCSSLKSIALVSDTVSLGACAFGYNYISGVLRRCDDFIIYGNNGSTVQSYAVNNGFDFYCIHCWEDSDNMIEDTVAETTCTVDGEYNRSCKICEWEKTTYIGAYGHDYGDGVVLSEPNCGKTGEMQFTCSRCGDIKYVELGKTGDTETILFNSGLTGTSPSYSSSNYDETSINNSGYDLYASYSTKQTIRLGLSFTADQLEYYTSHLVIEAYDTDESSGEVDGIYLVDETTNSRTRVGQLTGADSTWATTTLTISPSSLKTGHTYHFELTEEVSGWVVYVRSVTLELTGASHEYDEGVITTEPGCTSLGVRTYTCTVCGGTKTSAIIWKGHSYDSGVVTKEATCVADGVLTKTCSTCGKTSTSSITKTGHSWMTLYQPIDNVFELNAALYCTKCGNVTYEVFNSGVTDSSPKYKSTNVDLTSHNNGGYDLYSDYSSVPVIQTGRSFTPKENITGDVTLTVYAYDSDVSSGEVDGIYLVNETTGTETKLGKLSGSDSTWYTTEFTIPSSLFTVGHTYHIKLKEEVSGWVVYVRRVSITTANEVNPFTCEITKKPTCSEEGEIVYTFTNSSKKVTCVIPVIDHTYDNGVVTKEATCSETGEKLYTCIVCKATKTESIAKVAHVYGAGVVNEEATCNEYGKAIKTCINCGATSTTVSSVLGHDFGDPSNDGKIFFEPKAVECKRCNKKYYEIFNSRVSGNYSYYKTTDADGNTVSGNYDVTSVNNGGYDIRSFLGGRVQTGIEFTVNDKFRNPVDLEVLVYSTVLGSTCKLFLIDKTSGAEISLDQYKTTNSIWNMMVVKLFPEMFEEGHTYALEFKGGVLSTNYIRAVHIAEAESVHIYEESDRQEPQCATNGYVEYVCTHCGKSYVETIPATGHNYDEGKITVQPTCIENGVHSKICQTCGYVSETVTNELGHVLQQAPGDTFFYFGASDGLICSRCGAVLHTLFNSGRPVGSQPEGYSTLLGIIVTGNYDDASIDNGGYDIFSNKFLGTNIEQVRLGLNFTCLTPIPESVAVSAVINCYVPGGSGAKIYLVDETSNRTDTLVLMYGGDEQWHNAYIEIPASLLTEGHSYHLEMSCVSDGTLASFAAVRDAYIQVVDTEEHKWGTGVVTKEATCDENGEITFTCADADCTEKLIKTVPALGHNYVSEVFVKATCTENGIMRTKCTHCGDYTDSVIIAEHNYEFTDSKEATCDTEGYMEYTCSKCGDVYRETVTVTHDYIVSANKHATTTESGYVTYTCSVCGDTYKETIPALGTDKYVLLVRDRIPWTVEADYNLLNSLVSEGYISGWNVTSTSKINEINLADYAIVYIANDQTTATYNKLLAMNGTLEAYAENGGILIYGACDGGWANGKINGELPGGVSVGRNYALHNYVFDSKHRFVTGELTDLKAITDGLLYGTYCSHTYFDKSTLPEGSKIVLQDNNANPTLVEYPYGNGHIVLSGLTWEFYYVRNFLSASSTTTYSKNGFDDLFVYGLSLGLDEHTEHNFVATAIVDATCTESGSISYTCTGCSETEIVYLPAIGHSWGEWADAGDGVSHCRVCLNDEKHIDYAAHERNEGKVVVEATCCSEGEVEYSCNVCDTEFVEVLPVNSENHSEDNMVLENAVAPTCLDEGYSGDVKCNGCGSTIENGEVVKALGHSWGEWADSGNGTHIRICSNDITHTDSEDHLWDNGNIIKDPTCSEKGEIVYNCTVCKASKTEEIDLDHDNHSDYPTELVDSKDATCDVSGYTGDTICSECNTVLERGSIIEPTGHSWSEYTDNGDGTHTSACLNSECTVVITEDHAWSVIEKTDADCTAVGIIKLKCNTCPAEKNEESAALGHTLSEYKSNNDSTHSRECLRENGCVYTETENCSFGEWVTVEEPTCTEKGFKKKACSVCGYELTEEIAPLEHNWDKGVIDPVSTCKVHGIKTYTCQNDNSHKKTEKVELNPDNHVGETYIKDAKDETCTEEGYTGDTYCSDCNVILKNGESIEKLGHDMGGWNDNDNGTNTRVCQREGCTYSETETCSFGAWTTVKDSSCTDKGIKKRTCSVCGYVETAEIELKSHTPGKAVTENKVEPECEEKGSYDEVVYCTVCPKELSRVKKDIDAIGHNWGDWVIDLEPTFDTTGIRTKTCKNDASHIISEIVPVLTRPSDENENLDTDKSVDYDKLIGEATIKLHASSKGETITTKARVPLDIVLVLDQSGSMGPEYGNLIEDLRTATENFTEAIHKDAVENNLDHRISMVGFAMQAADRNYPKDYPKYLNTEILTTGQKPIQYDSLSSSQMNQWYKNSLVPVNINGVVNPVITLAIDNIEAKGATAADLGLDMACKVFSQNANDGSRKRIVVFMTDGEPTYSSGYNTTTADNAKAKAEFLKNTYDATVYSVGVLQKNVDSRAKPFLKAVASADARGNKLYYDCSDADQLVKDFEKIAEDSTVVVTDFDDITLVDTVSSAFTMTYLQEQQLRIDAVEKLGVKSEDVTVIRHPDGTTEIRIEHISPKKVVKGDVVNFVVDLDFKVTANEKALTAGSYVTNTENAGIVVGVKDVYENNFAVPNDTIEEADGVIYFNVNGITYHIVRVHAGESIKQPEINLEGGYSFSGWDIPEEVTFEGGKYTIDATLSQTEYTVTWITDTETKTEKYYYGDFIEVPEVRFNSQGDIFNSWDKEIPVTMPAENLTFTAKYKAHTHSYTESVNKKASCGIAGEMLFACLCGNTYTEVIDPLTHKWSTRATTSDETTAYSSVFCENCGDSPDDSLSYTVKGKVGKKTVEYDLKLVNAENITVKPDGKLSVSLPIPQEMSNAKNLKIYREEADGSLTDLGGVKSGSYITFTTEHFSKYIIRASYECENTGMHIDNNCDILCDLCGDEFADLGHKYTSTVTAPTCVKDGYTTHKCSVCGDEYTDSIKTKLGHNMSKYVVTQAATCTQNGSERSDCSRCDYYATRTVAKTNHNYGKAVTAATCTTGGYTTYTCSVCKDQYIGDKVSALGHKYDGNGTCIRCGDSKVDSCSCNCHKGGISGFFFKLILFFQKLFKANQICSCGVAHY